METYQWVLIGVFGGGLLLFAVGFIMWVFKSPNQHKLNYARLAREMKKAGIGTGSADETKADDKSSDKGESSKLSDATKGIWSLVVISFFPILVPAIFIWAAYVYVPNAFPTWSHTIGWNGFSGHSYFWWTIGTAIGIFFIALGSKGEWRDAVRRTGGWVVFCITFAWIALSILDRMRTNRIWPSTDTPVATVAPTSQVSAPTQLGEQKKLDVPVYNNPDNPTADASSVPPGPHAIWSNPIDLRGMNTPFDLDMQPGVWIRVNKDPNLIIFDEYGTKLSIYDHLKAAQKPVSGIDFLEFISGNPSRGGTITYYPHPR
jgi:MFS family permease